MMPSPAPHGLARHERLQALATRHGYPVVEYSEKLTGPFLLLLRLDLEALKAEGWFPLAVEDGRARVLTCRPPEEVAAQVQKILEVGGIDFILTLPEDLVRVIEHNQDVNPGFPPAAGRTPLARVRTYLAGRRSLFAHYRTLMAKSRTGLASIRTSLSFIAIALLLVRLLGTGYLLVLELPLLGAGLWVGFDSLRRYLPARRVNSILPSCQATAPTNGTTVLAVEDAEHFPRFTRLPEVPDAAALRAGWDRLTPVMRRRFLASDRTDLAEERTALACLRTRMAKARTGLAFVRTGTAFLSLGLGLMRAFPASSWLVYDLSLLGLGGLMMLEGFFWYARGRSSGHEGLFSVQQHDTTATIWDFFFPHAHDRFEKHAPPLAQPPVRGSHAPGVWATTGLALERTVLAERRNVMARVRTIMARSRTGMAFVRTGLSILLIGVIFLVYFPREGWAWGLFDASLALGGLALIFDGFYWTIPAERMRKQFPYCFADMEIVIPDYGVPARSWQKVVFDRASG